MNIILSIKPKYAQMILNGTKTVEFRRVFPSMQHVDKVIIYESAPTKMIVGEFKIEDIKTQLPYITWGEFGSYSGIDYNEYSEYVKGSMYCHAILIKDVIRYDTPKPLSDFGLTRPPQNYRFIKED